MSEWLKEHAWKLTPAARADAYKIPPTHFRSKTSRNIDMRRRVPVNDGACPGFRGVCDTVLTQSGFQLPPTRTDTQRFAWLRTRRLVRIQYLANLSHQRITGKRFLYERQPWFEDAVMVNGVFGIAGHV
jgi:hypothetical protein